MSVTIPLILSNSEFANLRIVADRLGRSPAQVMRDALKDFSIKIANSLPGVDLRDIECTDKEPSG